MNWFISALAFSIFTAAVMLVSQKYSMNGRLLSGLRGILIALCFLPAIFFVSVPKGELFWTLIIVQGFVSSFYIARLFQASAKYGASSTSIINVLSIAFALVIWWLINPDKFFALADNHLTFVAIIGALILVSIGFFYTSEGTVKRVEVLYMLPAVIALSIMVINRKEIMIGANFYSAVVYYCVFSIGISGTINLLVYLHRHKRVDSLKLILRDKHILKASVVMAIASGLAIVTGNIAVLHSPNPAYVNAVTLTIPIWVLVYNKFKHKSVEIKILPLSIMILGLGILVYFSDIPLYEH